MPVKHQFLPLLLLALYISFGCKKSDPSRIDVSQITHTDINGNLTSTADNSDWTSDASWSDAETALFVTPPAEQLTNTESGTITLSAGYPNPLATQQLIYVKSSAKAVMELVVTDNMLSIKKRDFINVSVNGYAVSSFYDPAIFSDSVNYRVYYGFYSQANGLFYKGHGDIRISR